MSFSRELEGVMGDMGSLGLKRKAESGWSPGIGEKIEWYMVLAQVNSPEEIDLMAMGVLYSS